MFDFNEKRKIRAWLYSKTMIVILLIPIGFLSMSVFERYQKERDTREVRAERSAELAEIEVHAAALEAKVEAALSDRGIEEEIRTRYDVAKEGEQVVIIIDDEEEQNEPQAETSPEPESNPILDFLKFW